MNQAPSSVWLRHLGLLFARQARYQDTDAELLRRYLADRDEAAFANLVQRHGAMVWNVCRRTLGHYQDAEDAFQAVFLILARKAAAVRAQASIAPWLYTVAQRVARKARAAASRQPQTAAVEPLAPDPFEAMTARDLLATLDEQVAALPARYRGPVVLCLLEGRTQEQAARLLNTSPTTVRRRLKKGQRMLQARLGRFGLTAAGALLTPAFAQALPASVLAAATKGLPPTERVAVLANLAVPVSAGKVKAAFALLLLLAMGAAGMALAAHVLRSAESPHVAQVKVANEPIKESQRLDPFGDPLPAGALLRFGSLHFKHGAAAR
jgi:RNA polymerase sigma factor (sigma-70 family)